VEDRRVFALVAVLLASSTAACDPYACGTEARSASYAGALGQAVPLASPPAAGDSGWIFLELNEWRGFESQQGVIAAVNVRGYVTAVSKLHVHEGAPDRPGRILWESANGYLAGDSIWQTGINRFEGPGPWSDLWTLLDSGRAYLEVHSPLGDSVAGGLRQVSSSPYSPACT